MDEKMITRNIWKGSIFCGVAALIVILVGGFTLVQLQASLVGLRKDQMQAEIIDYSDRITKQIQKDFQTMGTLVSFLQSSGMTQEPDLIKMLAQTNQSNDFVTIGYFDRDGIGAIAHPDLGVRRSINYRSLSPQVIESMDLAYKGHQNMSDLFESEVSNRRVFIYCVPVMEGDQVTAVLACSDYVEAFDSSLNEGMVLNGNGSIHLIDGSGTILISSRRLDKGGNLFSDGYLSPKDQEELKKVTKSSQKYGYVSLNAKAGVFTACMKSLGVNDWYILCVHDNKNAHSTANAIIRIITMVFLALILILLFLLAFTNRMLRKSKGFLMELAFKDPLTGADNMIRFEKNLEAARAGEEAFCLVSLRVRQFKLINEMYGEEASDRLLQGISRWIACSLREGEFFARENSDCFYLCLRQTDEEALSRRMKAMIQDICTHEHNEKRDFRLRLYAGAYIHQEEASCPLSGKQLLSRVSFASDSCWSAPMETIKFYDNILKNKDEMKNYVEGHMEQALHDGEFQVYLQPKIDLKSNRLGGAEALVRWVSQDKGMIYPDVFIPQFERNGFCVQLDLYMVEQVCRLMRSWMDQGLCPIPISVNQSKLLFYQSDYLSRLKACTDRYQVPPGLITLEILEGLALEHGEDLNDKLQDLRAMGFKISMDDFGCGYSSFNTLGNLEIDELKLDRSFLMDVSKGKSARFQTIMASIMTLSRNLHISTVTEGVETPEDEALIRSLGCDYGQGYLYSRPISEKDFTARYAKEFTEQCMRESTGQCMKDLARRCMREFTGQCARSATKTCTKA
ncbi:MAG: EAL domain-containing protein [Eubacteriales bacterium]|nr:EAL domain-containing protein [Eubacteriales bacterium]